MSRAVASQGQDARLSRHSFGPWETPPSLNVNKRRGKVRVGQSPRNHHPALLYPLAGGIFPRAPQDQKPVTWPPSRGAPTLRLLRLAEFFGDAAYTAEPSSRFTHSRAGRQHGTIPRSQDVPPSRGSLGFP